MRQSALLALAACALHAAIIRGTVVENQTGRPLARTLVTLVPVAGTSGPPRSVRSNLYGTFQFPPLRAGKYVVSASRTGFATIQYGQKQWKSAGVPVVVAEDDSPLLNIRLPRFGAITGTVMDENDVGLPKYEVVAYRNTRPPQLVTRATSDDRGMFRLFGLEPGSYLVRTVGKQYEEGGFLPTFSRETQIVDQAYPVDVDLDQQVDGIDVHPSPGRLFTLDVRIVTIPPNPIQPLPVTLTLASDVGRETVQGASHRFGPLPPGQYDLFAQAPLDGRPGIQGDYRRVSIGQDTTLTIVLRQAPELRFIFAGAAGSGAEPNSIQVLGRRKDLAGESSPEILKLTNNQVQLAPGPWELAIPATPGLYVSAFSGPAYQIPADGRADGWNEITVGAGPGVKFTLSLNPGALHGVVKSGSDLVAGVPVFLEPTDLEPRKRVTNIFVTRTDDRGQYQFKGVTPGNYRVLGTFEYRMPDSPAMSNARAKPVKVDEGSDALQDLDLYVDR